LALSARRVASASSVLCVVCLSGCTSPEPEPFVGVRWTEGNLGYSARSSDPLACADALSKVSDSRQTSADFWGRPRVSQAALEYWKFRDSSDFYEHADCPSESDACFDGAVRTSIPVDYHELAHAWVRAGVDVHTQFASEGIATALSCMPFSRSKLSDSPLSVALGSGPNLNFHAAGRLVMGLLALGSTQDLITWTERVDAAADPVATAATAALEIYGKPLEQIWSEASGETALPCFALSRCDAPLLPFAKTRLKTTCTGVTSYLLSRDLGPALGLSIVGAAPEILACSATAGAYAPSSTGFSDSPATAEYIIETPAEPRLLTLAERDPSLEALLTTRALPSAFARTCSLEDPLQLSVDETRIILPERSDTLYFPLQVESGMLDTTLVGSDVSGVSLAWCESCDSCAPSPSGTVVGTTGAGVLRVTLEQSTTSRVLSVLISNR